MKPHYATTHYLALLAAIASCGLGGFVAAENNNKDEHKPLSPEIVKAWRDVGSPLNEGDQ